MKKFFRKAFDFLKRLFYSLKDKKNILIFCIVTLVVSCEVWVPYLLAIITGNEWWWGIGSACWAFWLAPFTPFLPLCFGLTFAVRKVVDKIQLKRQKKVEE